VLLTADASAHNTLATTMGRTTASTFVPRVRNTALAVAFFGAILTGSLLTKSWQHHPDNRQESRSQWRHPTAQPKLHVCNQPLALSRLQSGEMRSADSGPSIEPRFQAVSLSKFVHPTNHVQGWVNADSANFHLIRTFVEQHGSPCFFVDVGSNHGFYAVFAARLGCQVHAYEPQLELRERACAAYALNGVSVSLYAAGIGRLNGHNEIIGEEGGAYLAPCTTSTGASRCTESFRLDDIYGRDRHITVMKVDVEGWEIGALRGAVQLLNRGTFGALLVEVAPARWLSRSQVSPSLGSAILAQLASIYDVNVVSDASDGGHCPPELLVRLEAAMESTPSSQSADNTHKRCSMPICEFEQHIFTTIRPHELGPLMRHMLEVTNRTSMEMSCNFWFVTPRTRQPFDNPVPSQN
jgi:FkbM family methyltransferase